MFPRGSQVQLTFLECKITREAVFPLFAAIPAEGVSLFYWVKWTKEARLDESVKVRALLDPVSACQEAESEAN